MRGARHPIAKLGIFTALGPDVEAVQADAELQEALGADSSWAEVFGNEAACDEP